MYGLIFTYSLAYGGAFVSLFRPFLGLLIYISFAILKPDALWPWAVPRGNYSLIVAIGMLVGWVLHGFGSRQLGKSRAIIIAFTGFMIWSVCSAVQAPDQERAWEFVDGMFKIFLPLLVGITEIDSVRKLKQLAWVIALSQGYLAYEINLSYFAGNNVVHEYGFAGQTDNNGVALAMHTCVPLAFILGLQCRAWWAKALAFGVATLMAHVVLLSFSREGMLGLLAAGAVTLFLLPKRSWHFVAFALALAIVLRLAGTEVRNRFWTILADPAERDSSAQSRVALWGNCLDLMRSNPMLGIGPNHFSLVSSEFGWPEKKEAHTLWLKMGAELGVPGLVLLVLFYGVCVVRLWPVARAREPSVDPWFADSARMVVASLVGFFVCTQFNNLYGIEVPYYVALLGAATLKLLPTPTSAGNNAEQHASAAQTTALLLPDA